ncbi:hypothetical protein HFO60_29720 [Rhizobium leguminosarum]|nr:hypothetical protein [Rhizobium leguminosarum]MBY5700123.1 hypothetical protein [Rhizobium leguminosarum]
MHLAHRIDPSRVSRRSKLDFIEGTSPPPFRGLAPAAELGRPLRHGLERDIDTTLGKQIVDIRQAQRKRKVWSHHMPDDLRGKAVALEMGGRIDSVDLPITISISINRKAMLPKIAEFRKKCRFRIWREQSSHAHQVFLKFSMDAYRSGCRKNNSRQARY